MARQPIETAPHDGTKILLWDSTEWVIGFWSEAWGMWMSGDDTYGINGVTAWEPLPPRPE